MNVNLTFRQIDPSDAFAARARELAEKIRPFLHRSARLRVVCSAESWLQDVELIIVAPGERFVARASGHDMYASLDEAYDKLMAQVRRASDRKRTGRRRGWRLAAET